MTYFEEVVEWDRATGLDASLDLRVDVMTEEWIELHEAIESEDEVAIADACADLIWTVLGLAHHYRFPFDAVWDEVRRSNAAKVGPNGEVHRREDGKIVKPPEWSPPDIKRILREAAS